MRGYGAQNVVGQAPGPAAYGMAAQQRLPGMRAYSQGFTAPPDAQYSAKPTPPPTPSPQGVMGPPGNLVSQQQLMQSPPPIRSPQPNPSPRPVVSPRNQPVQSPRGGPSPLHHQELGTPNDLMLSQLGSASQQPPTSDTGELTPQDQLSKFVEQL